MVQKVSIIIPAYNEEDNIEPLLKKINELVLNSKIKFEAILVDDGSTDKTYKIASDFRKKYKFLKVFKHRLNLGKTEAIITGFKNSTGDSICILDADLQYDPLEIPLLINKLNEGYDIVTGWKKGKYEKKFVSVVYNFLSRLLFHIHIHDQNSIKLLRKEVLEEINLRKDWHRYIVSLAVEKGFKDAEVKVTLYPRYSGKPKYSGKGRILIGFLDLLSVKFQISFMKKPLLLFGSAGLISIILGIFVGIYDIILRFFFHRGWRPLLYLTMLLIISGLLLFALGFLSEIISRIEERIERIEKGMKD